MNIFENKVGRPSNKTIRIRRAAYVMIFISAIIFVGVGAYYVSNIFKNDNIDSSGKNAAISNIAINISPVNSKKIKFSQDVKSESVKNFDVQSKGIHLIKADISKSIKKNVYYKTFIYDDEKYESKPKSTSACYLMLSSSVSSSKTVSLTINDSNKVKALKVKVYASKNLCSSDKNSLGSTGFSTNSISVAVFRLNTSANKFKYIHLVESNANKSVISVCTDCEKGIDVGDVVQTYDYNGIEVYTSATKTGAYTKIATETRADFHYKITIDTSKVKKYYKIRTYSTTSGKKVYSDFSEPYELQLVPDFKAEYTLANSSSTTDNYSLKVYNMAGYLTDDQTKLSLFSSNNKSGKFTQMNEKFTLKKDADGSKFITSFSLKNGEEKYYKVTISRKVNNITLQRDIEVTKSNSSNISASKYKYIYLTESDAKKSQIVVCLDCENGVDGGDMHINYDYKGIEVFASNTKDGSYTKISTQRKADTQYRITIDTSALKKYYKVRTFSDVNGSTVYSDFSDPVELQLVPQFNYTVSLKESTDTLDNYVVKISGMYLLDDQSIFEIYTSDTENGSYTLVNEKFILNQSDSATINIPIKKSTTKYFKVVLTRTANGITLKREFNSHKLEVAQNTSNTAGLSKL